MDKLVIRKVNPSEIGLLQNIARQTFVDTFSGSNTEENMNKYLEEKLSAEVLLSELNDDRSDFYFAVLNDEVVGYLKLNTGSSQTELRDGNAIEIERIYVSKEFHGKKVAQALYNQAIETAKQHNADYIWLGVWEENARAIAFYKKNGFVAFDKHIFRLGDDEQVDVMMKRQLGKENLSV